MEWESMGDGETFRLWVGTGWIIRHEKYFECMDLAGGIKMACSESMVFVPCRKVSSKVEVDLDVMWQKAVRKNSPEKVEFLLVEEPGVIDADDFVKRFEQFTETGILEFKKVAMYRVTPGGAHEEWEFGGYILRVNGINGRQSLRYAK